MNDPWQQLEDDEHHYLQNLLKKAARSARTRVTMLKKQGDSDWEFADGELAMVESISAKLFPGMDLHRRHYVRKPQRDAE